MATVDFLGRAIDLAKQATEEDAAEHYPEAYKLYQKSLDYFAKAMKYEKNERLKDAIRKKFAEYLDRAELLKGYIVQLEEQKKNGDVQPNPQGTGATKGKKKSGGNDDEEDTRKLRSGLE
ncbi:Vacuolar protein sorting-associated protein 4, partial [Dimargaris verticillata]